MNKNKRAAAIVVMIISVLPWLFALGYGIYYAFAGVHRGIDTRWVEYGFEAFIESFLLLVLRYWYIFLASLCIMFGCISELSYLKKKQDDE